MFGGCPDHLVLGSGDVQGAVALARHLAAIHVLAGHMDLLWLSPGAGLSGRQMSVKAAAQAGIATVDLTGSHEPGPDHAQRCRHFGRGEDARARDRLIPGAAFGERLDRRDSPPDLRLPHGAALPLPHAVRAGRAARERDALVAWHGYRRLSSGSTVHSPQS